MTPPSTLFKVLSDETRLRTTLLLLQHGELCVCELTQALDVSQPKMSRHLAALREAGMVSDRKQGLWVFYRINPELDTWALGILRATAEGLGAMHLYAEDAQGLRLIADAPNRCRVA